MIRIHLCADPESIRAVLGWLEAECQITPQTLVSNISYESASGGASDQLPALHWVHVSDAGRIVQPDDIVIVAGPDSQRAIGDLLGHGIRNLYDGNAMLTLASPGRRFLTAAAGLYIGPAIQSGEGAPPTEASRFAVEAIRAGGVPRHKLFIVNSLPKSGTVWMVAMLESILGVQAEQQITVSHVGDLEDDWNKVNNHGAVALVRDMRDVVVSWFHNASRTDRELGYAEPRYPSVERFYDEFFVGTLYGTKRFYYGDLERWLNLVSANYIPLIKYEDMVADTAACLRKVMNFWKVDVAAPVLARAVSDHSFASMAGTVGRRTGFVGDMVRAGHLRRGQVGGWRHEMPEAMARDISRRFAGYQGRLGYDKE
jgi:hypothetical protein